MLFRSTSEQAKALTEGTVNVTANVSDADGNPATQASASFTYDKTAPTVTSTDAAGTGINSGTDFLKAGGVVTLTVNTSEAVFVDTSGGTPTLSLSSGGAATYTGGSGTTALSFSYTVGASDNASDLTITALNANGATLAEIGRAHV